MAVTSQRDSKRFTHFLQCDKGPTKTRIDCAYSSSARISCFDPHSPHGAKPNNCHQQPHAIPSFIQSSLDLEVATNKPNPHRERALSLTACNEHPGFAIHFPCPQPTININIHLSEHRNVNIVTPSSGSPTRATSESLDMLCVSGDTVCVLLSRHQRIAFRTDGTRRQNFETTHDTTLQSQ